MPDMSSDQIRDIAVRCVEGFFNDKVPLSAGLAKEASAGDLNLEQIKRASEVANTVCQLKLMQLSEDKTIEFPLCKVAEVMATLCLPDATSEGSGLAKQASVEESEIVGPIPSLEKYAGLELSAHERTLNFIKEASVEAKVLEQLEDRALIVKEQLMKVAQQVEKDPKWLDKLSSVHSDNFAELSLLVSGATAAPRDFGNHAMFKEADLKAVKTMSDLYKEARAIVAETSRRRGLQKRAEDLSAELTKEAFLGSLAGAGANLAGRAIGGIGRLGGKAALGVGLGAAGLVGKGALNSLGFGKPSPAGKLAGAVAVDSLSHIASGGVGYAKNGETKNVWDALQS